MASVPIDDNTVKGLLALDDTTSLGIPVKAKTSTGALYVHIDSSDLSSIDVTTNTNHTDKYYTSTGAVTDGIIWSPASGKRWHVVTLYLNVSAAATVTIEDDLATGDVVRWKGDLAANSGVVLPYGDEHPMASGEDAADLIITTSAGNVYVQCVGYEV